MQNVILWGIKTLLQLLLAWGEVRWSSPDIPRICKVFCLLPSMSPSNQAHCKPRLEALPRSAAILGSPFTFSPAKPPLRSSDFEDHPCPTAFDLTYYLHSIAARAITAKYRASKRSVDKPHPLCEIHPGHYQHHPCSVLRQQKSSNNRKRSSARQACF